MGVKAGLVVIPGLLIAACSSPSASSHDAAAGAAGGGGASDGAPVVDADLSTPRGFCLGLLEVVAEEFATCFGVSLADAQRSFVNELPCERLASSIAAGKVSFDGTHAASCLADVRTLATCGNSDSLMQQSSNCATVLTPRVPVGGTCSSFYLITIGQECQDAAYCREGANYACSGVCTARAAVGGACDFATDLRCVEGATCDSTSKTCVTSPAPGEGQPCGGANQASCQRTLYCDTTGSDGGSSGVCHAQKASGPCVYSGDCVSTERCVGVTTKVCAPVKNVGDACTPGARECGLLGHCGADSKCTNALAAIGAPCGYMATEFVGCVDGAYCDSAPVGVGVCVANKHAGDACTATPLSQCEGNNAHCDTTTHQCGVCPI